MECYNMDASFSDNRRCFCNSLCTCTGCCYVLSLILFTVGSSLTIFAVYDREGYFVSLGQLWIIGPILMCSGVMLAKATIYAHRRNILILLARQTVLGCSSDDPHSPRGPVGYPLPPSYTASTVECSQQPPSSTLLSTAYTPIAPVNTHNDPPPCYEEALLGEVVEPGQFLKGPSQSQTKLPV